jgi:hypothetical protein
MICLSSLKEWLLSDFVIGLLPPFVSFSNLVVACSANLVLAICPVEPVLQLF